MRLPRFPLPKSFLPTFCAWLAVPLLLLAPPVPQWWTQRGAVDTTKTADDYAAANIGQLKWMAIKATTELNTNLPGGAGTTLNNLVNSWQSPAPSPTPAPGTNRDDYAVLTVGQLKYVAALFYDRLIAVGLKSQYPWTASSVPADDYAIANLGQIKYLFSFTLPPLSVAIPVALATPAPTPLRTLPGMPQPIIGGATGGLTPGNGTPPSILPPSSNTKISAESPASNQPPASYPSGNNPIVANGNFSTPTIDVNTPPGDYGLFYYKQGEVSPWTAVSGSVIEMQDRDGKYDGQYIELDSDWSNSDHTGNSDHGIKQDVSLARGHYTLSFNYKHRNDESGSSSLNSIKVSLTPAGGDPSTLASIKVTNSDWKSCQVSFEVSGGNAAGTSATLSFDITDQPDSLGAYVDSIFIKASNPPGKYTIPFSEASGSRYRKIALNGRPLPDEKPQHTAESDQEKEETYIDALTMGLHHSVTDVYVPIAGSDLALAVRRNTQSEDWNVRNGILPKERLDRPFGASWNSNLSASLHVVYDDFITYFYVTDQNGAQHRFLYQNGLYVPMPSDSRENGDYLTSLTLSPDGSFVFMDRYGTKMTFVYSVFFPIPKSRDPDADPNEVEYDYYYRVQTVADRLGNTLVYQYPAGSVTLTPNRISLKDHSDQALIISSVAGHIDTITDPNGKVYHYSYVYGPSSPNGVASDVAVLSTVKNPKQETTTYGYEFVIEGDLTPSIVNDGKPTDKYHLDVNSITDPRQKTWGFSYKVDQTRWDYSTEAGYYRQTGAPRNVVEIQLPDGRKTTLNNQSYVAVDGTPALLPGSQRKIVVTDAHLVGSTDPSEQGHLINYTFDQEKVFNVAGIYQDTPAWAIPKVVFYTEMVINYPGIGSETFAFDSTAGLALKSVVDLSSNTTSYTYGDPYTPAGLPAAFPSGLFGHYEDPTIQTNALGKTKQFHYSSSYRIMDQTTDESGRMTSYVVDSSGRRKQETIKNAQGGVIQDTLFEYTDTRFPGVVTKKTVSAISLSPSPTGVWYVDLVTAYALDNAGHVATETVKNPGGTDLVTTYIYDANGNKLTATDPLNHTTWFFYDDCNRLKQVVYFDGRDKTFGYDLRGNKTRETDENGYSTLYAYDNLNRLTDQARDMNGNGQIDRPVDLVTTFTYNGVNSKLTQQDPNGNITTFTYDDLQRLTSTLTAGVTEAPSGYTTTYDYSGPNAGASAFDSSAFKPTRITAPPLKTGDPSFITNITYDKLYRSTNKSVEYKTGVYANTATGYDDVGNATSVTDDLGHSTGTTYDALNRPLRTTFADGKYVENSYTGTGLKWLVEDERHNKTETRYDGAGRPEFVWQPLVFDADTNTNKQPTTQTIYDLAGNVKATINPRGQRWDYTYDVRNRKLTEQQPAVVDSVTGNTSRPTITTGYDDVGNTLYVTDARGYTSETLYDKANRAYQVTAPPVPVYGQAATRPVTSKSYDNNGNVLTVTDANTHTTTNTYDALNRLKTTLDAQNILVKNDYDSAGNLIKVTDGKNQVTQFAYDGLNRNTGITDFATKTTTFAYNGVNKTSRTDALTQVTAYGYDARNRLQTVTYPGRTSDNRTYGYDDHGNLTSVSEPGKAGAADVGTTYDALNRALTETSSGLTHSYAYDLAGNRLTATYGGTGRVLTSTYDSLNRLSTLTENGRATSYGYDLNGNTTKKALPNNEVVTTTYDGMNRAQTILGKKPNGTLSYQYLNGYDRAGNVLWVDEFYNDIPIWRDIVMDYDNANRLWHEIVADQTGNTKTTTYAYDNAHNRTGTTVSNTSGAATVTSVFGFNNLNQLTSYTETGGSAARNVAYGYDFAGNRKTRTENSQTDTYGYDYEQRLVSLTKNTTGGTGAYGYVYDYRTRRVGRTEGSTTTRLVFSGGTSVQEYTGTAIPANLTAEYVRGSDYGGGVGGVLYSLRATIPSYNHYDRRGDVTEKTNGAGATTYQASYQPFGLHPNDFGSTQDRQKANTKEEDPTGLLNENQRYRDLEIGMFITRDPAGFVDGPNLYTYVKQNPWTAFDPEGLKAAINAEEKKALLQKADDLDNQAKENRSAAQSSDASLQNTGDSLFAKMASDYRDKAKKLENSAKEMRKAAEVLSTDETQYQSKVRELYAGGSAQVPADISAFYASAFNDKMGMAFAQQQSKMEWVPNLVDNSVKLSLNIVAGVLLDRFVAVPGTAARGGGAGTEVVQRWMSQAELQATQSTGLLRGGRDGVHFVTDAANTAAQRARLRLALPQTPEVRVTLEVPGGAFSAPTRVQPRFNMPGGGMERSATGQIPVKVLGVD